MARVDQGISQKKISSPQNKHSKETNFNFLTKDNETFYQAWERFKGLLLSCPHHGYETWRAIEFFYDGLTSNMRQYLNKMCNGKFIDKDPNEVRDYTEILAEKTQTSEDTEKVERSKPTSSSKGGLFHLREGDDFNIKLANLARKVEALEIKNASSSKS